ncbi:MAG TPA: SAM-dependent chlorinase/fluorinase [Terriglobia bacterium]|nr:SAM-dependent chlorinase/fluorinase [Terriglobia bacterium]
MIITLTTDFGLIDPYVGVMKGVILGLASAANIVDLTHDIPSYDIQGGAFALASAVRHFPEGTVHVVVVDPGVGGARFPIAAERGGQRFVGPDNGVLSLALGMLEGEMAAHRIANESWFRHPVSQTFHGRDIFAPTAAHLALGEPVSAAGPRIGAIAQLTPPGNQGRGARVLNIDKFGNIVTSLRPGELGRGFGLRIGGREVRGLLSSYEDAPTGELFAIEGSAGFVEISLKEDSAALALSVRRGAQIEVETGDVNH